MVINRTVGIPAQLAERIQKGGRGVSTRLKELVVRAIQDEMPLAAPIQRELIYIPVALDSALDESIQAARSRMPAGHDWSDAQVIAALAVAGSDFKQERTYSAAPTLTPTQDLLGQLERFSPRPEQMVLARLVDSVQAGAKIGMLEAATGTGKGLVMALAAAAFAPERRTVIAAPTHQINRQTYRHLVHDLPATKRGAIDVAVIYGRSSFVSVSALSSVLVEDTSLDAATIESAGGWIDGQRRAFKSGQRAGLFLMEDLLKLCPALPKEDLALRAYEDGPEADCYTAQFASAKTAHVVLMTHTMLAILNRQARMQAMRSRPATNEEAVLWRDFNALLAEEHPLNIGSIDLLLIDEAHAFEASVANAMSEVISLRAMLRRCRHLDVAIGGTKGKLAALASVIDGFARFDDGAAMTTGGADGQTVAQEALVGFAETLDAFLKRFTDKGRQRVALDSTHRSMLEDVRRQAAALQFGLKAKKAQIVHLRHSPDRRYPQLTVGPRSVLRDLDFLWQQVGAACLFSATLYNDSGMGIPSASRIASRLSIDPIRVLTHVPVQPSWVTDPVTLHLPLEGSSSWAPPKADDPREAWEGYWASMAAGVERFCASAEGGSIVLCTSHEAIKELSQRWKTDGGRVMTHRKDHPFAATLQAFVQRSLAGERPVWFATGQAWTGLDVYAALPEGLLLAPDEDRVLTHLAIPRVPFDIGSTSTEIARRQRSGQAWLSIVNDAQLLLRQGIGRLVRRQGLRDRHLAIFDPRATDARLSGAAPIRAIWARYPKRAGLMLVADPVDAVPPVAVAEMVSTISDGPRVSATRKRVVFD